MQGGEYEIQDGGSQTGNTYVSTIISRSCMIPTTISTLLRLRNSTELIPTYCDASGSKKSKMAAHKQEILIFQLVYTTA